VIRVLVVEDEPVAAEAHRVYVERVPGFTVVAVAPTGAAAVRALRGEGTTAQGGDGPVDLVLLDMHLPDRHGLDVVRTMRSVGHPADVIAITSARDLAVVRSAVSLGIVQYLLKPFTFAALRDKLERYAEYRERVLAEPAVSGQAEVDQALAALRGSGTAPLPKGMVSQTLDAVVRTLREEPSRSLSATEVAEALGASRVTARRYLEYLADNGMAVRGQRYGGAGRPEVEYRWRGSPAPP
jgi:response regulator of citrate/malate metabolism